MASLALDRELKDSANPPVLRERGDAETLRVMLQGELQAGRWQEGERLPTERELGERYGMARNTVRRALQALEEQGLIARFVGRGTFRTAKGALPPATAADTSDAIAGASPADILECRLAFEPELASLVVARASQADLNRMEQCLRGGEAAQDVGEFEVWDGALHDAIAVATRNQAVIAMTRLLGKVRLQAEWGQLKAQGMTAEHRAQLEREHRAIVAAFCRRDKAAARRCLQEHLLHVHSYMFGD
jgi:DNA-binding FadR family transcriptional regulator